MSDFLVAVYKGVVTLVNHSSSQKSKFSAQPKPRGHMAWYADPECNQLYFPEKLLVYLIRFDFSDANPELGNFVDKLFAVYEVNLLLARI